MVAWSAEMMVAEMVVSSMKVYFLDFVTDEFWVMDMVAEMVDT